MSVQELGWKCKAVYGSASVTMPYNRINTVFICAGSGSGMKDEVIDVFFFTSGAPATSITELATSLNK